MFPITDTSVHDGAQGVEYIQSRHFSLLYSTASGLSPRLASRTWHYGRSLRSLSLFTRLRRHVQKE
jgi:hypothetical protein